LRKVVFDNPKGVVDPLFIENHCLFFCRVTFEVQPKVSLIIIRNYRYTLLYFSEIKLVPRSTAQNRASGSSEGKIRVGEDGGRENGLQSSTVHFLRLPLRIFILFEGFGPRLAYLISGSMGDGQRLKRVREVLGYVLA
jgi:hypothetical protein